VIGGHRLGQEVRRGPRIVAPPYQDKTAVATALQAGVNVAVNAAALNAPNKFVVVSGLTYCVGLVAGRWNGNGFTTAITAHFNGNYASADASDRISDGLGAGGGPISAVIVVTSDSTALDVDLHIPTIFDHLVRLGAPAERVLLYWSSTSGVAFLLDGAGFMGERRNIHDFPY
jgi:hypothetical protein